MRWEPCYAGDMIMKETPEGLNEVALEPEAKLPYNIAVCVGHCCKRHGCKYSKEACVVVSGEYAQSYPCEMCGSVASLERTIADYNEELAWSRELEASGVPIHDYGNKYDY